MPHLTPWCSPPVAAKASYTVKPWAPTLDPVTPCHRAAAEGVTVTTPIPELTVGLLTHEPTALAKSMRTYDELGLFPLVSEFIVFINTRCAAKGGGAAAWAVTVGPAASD